jgi:hypothetical protein
MGRSTARKITPVHTAVGGARPADFEGADFSLRGFWIHPTRRLTVEVPILQHGFYPKLDHTDLDIERQVQYRMVQMPSLSDLRKAGIEADQAAFIAEIWVHPRYIKNWNYFRTDFPANVKTLVRNTNFAFVFPANDMPFARFKRKEVLQFWRSAFTPLFIDGKHYTSGRMSMFFVAPPHVSAGFRRKLNLEHDEDFNNLVEWSPEEWRLRQTRMRRPSMRREISPEIFYGFRPQVVDETSARLEREIGPIITSKLGIDPRSNEGKAILHILQDKELSKSLLAKTQNKKYRFPAVKAWVKYNLWPRISSFAKEEGAAIGRSMLDFAFKTTVTVAVNAMLEKLVGRPIENPKVAARYKRRYPTRYIVRQAAGKFEYTPSQYSTATQIGAGTLSYKFRTNAQDKESMMNALRQEAFRLYKQLSGDDVGPIGKEFIKISFAPGDRVRLSLDSKQIEHFYHEVPEYLLGNFANPDWAESAKVYLRMVERDINSIYQEMKLSGAEY